MRNDIRMLQFCDQLVFQEEAIEGADAFGEIRNLPHHFEHDLQCRPILFPQDKRQSGR